MRHILVVDDDEDVREVLRELFVLEGYGVSVAASGEEALELLARTPPPSLLVLDDHMPGMGGLDVVEALRARAVLRRLPVVLLSSAVHGGVAGVHAFIRKPVDPQHLLHAVARFGRAPLPRAS